MDRMEDSPSDLERRFAFLPERDSCQVKSVLQPIKRSDQQDAFASSFTSVGGDVRSAEWPCQSPQRYTIYTRGMDETCSKA